LLAPAAHVPQRFLLFLLAFSLGALGILIASRIKSIEAFQVTMQMLMFPMRPRIAGENRGVSRTPRAGR